MISVNLRNLRKLHKLTQEDVAEKVGVTRQALAKWETGETVPDVLSGMKLAEVYDVSLDALVNYSDEVGGTLIAPKGKHMFGTVTIGERGQIVIPKEAREHFGYKVGNKLVVLGDDESGGIALVKAELFENMINDIMAAMKIGPKKGGGTN